MMNGDIRRTARCVVLAVLIACGGGGSEPPSVGSVTIELGASPPALVPGESFTLTWQVRDARGGAAADQGVAFTSSDPSRVTVTSAGVLTAVAPGSASVTARQGSAQSQVSVNVTEGGVVGAAGGSVTALSGRVRLDVPAGAVSEPTVIRVSSATNPLLDPTEVTGSVVSVQPSQAQFQRPVTVRVAFDESRGPVGLQPSLLRLRRYVADAWTAVDSAATDATARVARGVITGAATLSVGWVPPGAPCTSPESRQFDFWIGRWTVTERGQPAGLSDITVAPGGCAIFEHFRSAGVGRSISFHDPVSGRWYQTYVDDAGNRLLLGGVFARDAMDLVTPPMGGTVHARTRWVAEGVNVRQQVAALSRDGGVTYAAPQYDFVYVPR